MSKVWALKSFVFTDEYYRFAEFCAACGKHRYIGLCYGPPGVGKTLSARRYTRIDELEHFDLNADSLDNMIERLSEAAAVLYTPGVTASPSAVHDGIEGSCQRLRNLLVERVRRQHEPQLNELRERVTHVQGPQHTNGHRDAAWEEFHVGVRAYNRDCEAIPKLSASLVIIDEADRLKMTSLEQVRDIFDRSGVGIVLIGMPGIEKRLARYPQLYSRVGFVHEYAPLTKVQLLAVMNSPWRPDGVTLPIELFDPDSLAALVRITGGNFRLLHRLLTQIARILEINELNRVTPAVVDTARESLVIGVA